MCTLVFMCIRIYILYIYIYIYVAYEGRHIDSIHMNSKRVLS